MKTRKLLTRYAWMPLIAAGLTACDMDEVKSVDFGVNLETATAYVGDAVQFQFDGNPDYIIFYPGTKACSYANRERSRLELDSIGISCRIDQVYTDLPSYSGKEKTIMHAFISKDYTGELTPEALQKANWTDISGDGENQLNMPVATTSPTVPTVDSNINLSPYLNSQFYIAFRYAAGPNNTPGSTYSKPRVQIKDLTLVKREPDNNIIKMADAVGEWGFNTIRVKVASPNNTKYEVSKNELFFFPDAATEKSRDSEVWMVSQLLTPEAVQPDRGMPIKGTNAKLPTYEFTYTKPGTYTATFVATNANIWDSKQTVREVTVTVKEKTVANQHIN